MGFLSLYGREVFAIFVVLLTWALNNRFKNKAKLSYGCQHRFTFLVQESLRDANGEMILYSQLVHAQSIFLVNEGR